MQGLTDGEKQSEIQTLSVSLLLTSFVGALPPVGAEEDEDDESPWDSEVLSVKGTGVWGVSHWGQGEGRSKIQKHLRACF